MVKIFKGQQFVKILFKNQQKYQLTNSIPMQLFNKGTYHSFLEKYKIEAHNPKLLVYQMTRKSNSNDITITTVILAKVSTLPCLQQHLLNKKKEEMESYISKISNSLPSLDILAGEGDEVQILK